MTPTCERPWVRGWHYSHNLTTAADDGRKPCPNPAVYTWHVWQLEIPLYDDDGARIPFRDREVIEVERELLACRQCTGLSRRDRKRVEAGETVRFHGDRGEVGCVEMTLLT